MKDIKLGENMLIPASVVGVFISLVAMGSWWASFMYSRVESIESQSEKSEVKYEQLVKEVRTVNETLVEIKAVLKQGKRYGN